jgi:uncharacterized protein (DUF362 family)
VQAALTLIKDDIKIALSKISLIIIKINLVVVRVELSTTPFQAVKGFIDFISPFYKGKIIIAEKASWGNTQEGFKKYGFTELAEENSHIKLLDLKEDETVLKELHYPEGILDLPLSRTMLETPFLVSIVRPKTHSSVGITLSIKNVLVGMIQKVNMRKKFHRGKYISYNLANIAEYAFPDFAIIDGTIGMEGDGPIMGTAINAGWALASFDAFAADSLATYLMGFNVDEIGYLALLREREKEFGALYPKDDVEILGEEPENLVTPFKPHKNFEKTVRMWCI